MNSPMKHSRFISPVRFLVLVLGLHAIGAGTVSAQSYSIPWQRIAGGGGTSSNGVYTLHGTLGQHEAGPPAGQGGLRVTGGFWAQPIVIQTPGAPVLQVAAGAPGQVILSWVPATPGFILQESTSLQAGVWTDVAGGSGTPVTVTLGPGLRFFRLQAK